MLNVIRWFIVTGNTDVNNNIFIEQNRIMGAKESTLQEYIDSSMGIHHIKHLFENESVDTRYSILMNVKGKENSTWTGLHEASRINDLENIVLMLTDFSSSQLYNVVKIQNIYQWTALHYAAVKGYTSIINYLLNNLSQQQKYDLLKIQDENGNTALHIAAMNKKVEAVQAITSSVSSHLQILLINIKNKKGQTVTDIRPELHDELPVLIHRSRSTKLH